MIAALPRTEAELRTIAMPANTNRFGDIFGGWLLAQMDLAGGSYAMTRTGGRVATVGIGAMSFHQPVFLVLKPPTFKAWTIRSWSISILVRTNLPAITLGKALLNACPVSSERD